MSHITTLVSLMDMSCSAFLICCCQFQMLDLNTVIIGDFSVTLRRSMPNFNMIFNSECLCLRLLMPNTSHRSESTCIVFVLLWFAGEKTPCQCELTSSLTKTTTKTTTTDVLILTWNKKEYMQLILFCLYGFCYWNSTCQIKNVIILCQRLAKSFLWNWDGP